MLLLTAFGMLQETLEEGCEKIDEIVESFGQVGLRDRSMVWNTDLVEVGEECKLLAVSVPQRMHLASELCPCMGSCPRLRSLCSALLRVFLAHSDKVCYPVAGV